MGMDVHGKNPTTEAGKYFHANVWHWRPLWDYCHLVAKDIIRIEGSISQSGADFLSIRVPPHLSCGHSGPSVSGAWDAFGWSRY